MTELYEGLPLTVDVSLREPMVMAGMMADRRSFGSAPELISAKCVDKQVDHANRNAVVK